MTLIANGKLEQSNLELRIGEFRISFSGFIFKGKSYHRSFICLKNTRNGSPLNNAQDK